MKQYATEQENFWAGEFGDEYIERNQGKEVLASKIGFWSRIVHSGGQSLPALSLDRISD